MENNPQKLNPWISMWIKPRATMQQIINTHPEHLVMVLASLYGVASVLSRAHLKNLGDKWDLLNIVLFAAIAGPILGIIWLHISTALIRWTGSWIGGKASAEHIRAAVAWSNVPIVWALPLWIPELAIFGQELFTSETPMINESTPLAFLFFGFKLIDDIAGIWAIVVFLKCLGQVQNFSAWKALGNVLLAIFVIFAPIMAILLLFRFA